jgi:hypothetical protein
LDDEALRINFLDNECIFNDLDLELFRKKSNFSETAYVNIAVNTSIITKTLDFELIGLPATSHSIETFKINLHSDDTEEFQNKKGQVEIDTLFIEIRDGKKKLFVTEAKMDNVHRLLAKHKLVYPCIMIAALYDSEIELIPIYFLNCKNKLKQSPLYCFADQ